MSRKDDTPDFDSPLMIPARDRRRKLAARARAILTAVARKKSLWEVMDEYTLAAFVELRHALMTGDSLTRFQAADRIASIWTKMPPRPALPPETGVTVGSEEWLQRCRDALADPAVMAFAVKEGWTAPVAGKERN